MARLPRLDLAGVPQHVLQRGNNRHPCFFDVADYTFYLDALRCAAHQHGCAVYAYVLMTNHVHLLVSDAQVGDVSAMMQTLGRRYVRRINQRYGRTGTLWEGRFKSSYPRQALGLGDDWLVDHECDVALGQDAASRQTAYQGWFRQPLALVELSTSRSRMNRSGILGSDRFQEEIARVLGRRVQPAKPGRPRQTPNASHAERIMLL